MGSASPATIAHDLHVGAPAVARRAGALVAGLALVWLVAAPPIVGGDPSPTTPRMDVWLDAPLPATAAAGSTVRIGFMAWDPVSQRLARDIAPFIRIAASTGGDAGKSPTAQDFTGHFVASVQVPDGGVARVEIGLTGSACDAQGCRESDWLFDIVGVGPPPDAPLPSVATARVELPADAVTAGRPAVIGIRLTPRVAWDPAAFRYPDTLLVEVAVPRGRTILDAQAALADGSPGTYSASVTIPDPGEYRVVAAVPQQGADPVPFSASLTTMTVEPPGAVPSPAGEGDGESGLGAVIPAIVAVVAVLAVVALLAGRARFRDRDA